MKTTRKITGLCLVAFIVAGVVFALALQRKELNRLHQENRLLQQRVDVQIADADQLAQENRRLSTLIATKQTSPGAPSLPDQAREILRLRGEVGRLRFLETEAAQSRRAQMQAAQTKLTNAEVELLRFTQLHSEKLVSGAELSRAKFAVELLRAEAKGDAVAADQIRLRQAEEELAHATELLRRSLISQAEYDEAARKVEVLRAEGR